MDYFFHLKMFQRGWEKLDFLMIVMKKKSYDEKKKLEKFQ